MKRKQGSTAVACYCDTPDPRPAVERVSLRKSTAGQPFLTCASGECKFFRWSNDVVDDYDDGDGFVASEGEEGDEEYVSSLSSLSSEEDEDQDEDEDDPLEIPAPLQPYFESDPPRREEIPKELCHMCGEDAYDPDADDPYAWYVNGMLADGGGPVPLVAFCDECARQAQDALVDPGETPLYLYGKGFKPHTVSYKPAQQ